MGKKANPAVIGAFVVAAVALAVAGLAVFGGGKLFREVEMWVLYFDESVKGLAVGAPVTANGVKIGSVRDIKVVIDRKNFTARTPVFIALEADRVVGPAGERIRFQPGAIGTKALIERGLRAQLQVQSFVTGQLAIELNFHPGTPVKLAGLTQDIPEFPTVPSTGEKLAQTLENLRLDELVNSVKEAVDGFNRLVNAPEVREVLLAATRTLKGAERLVAAADKRVLVPLGAGIERLSTDASDTLRDVRKLVGHVDDHTVPAVNEAAQAAGTLLRDLDAQTMPAANELLGDLRRLARNLETTSDEARTALQEARKTLVTVAGVVEEGSPLEYQLSTALQEMQAAARAVRHFADSLERHPEALLVGKDQR